MTLSDVKTGTLRIFGSVTLIVIEVEEGEGGCRVISFVCFDGQKGLAW